MRHLCQDTGGVHPRRVPVPSTGEGAKLRPKTREERGRLGSRTGGRLGLVDCHWQLEENEALGRREETVGKATERRQRRRIERLQNLLWGDPAGFEQECDRIVDGWVKEIWRRATLMSRGRLRGTGSVMDALTRAREQFQQVTEGAKGPDLENEVARQGVRVANRALETLRHEYCKAVALTLEKGLYRAPGGKRPSRDYRRRILQ